MLGRHAAWLRSLAAAALSFAAAASCLAQSKDDWPSRPVRVVVPNAAGSAADLFARLFADRLRQALKQPFVVDNKPGANGAIGNTAVAKAAPDGYTLLYSYAGATVMNQAMQGTPHYDVLRDFTPIAQVGAGGNPLIVSPDFPAQDLAEFVAHVKANPDKYDYASIGLGSAGHLTMEWLKARTGIQIRHVPYKTGPQILVDIQSGVIKVAIMDAATTAPLVRAGKIRALGVSGTFKGPIMPDVKTMAEQGYPFDLNGWYGFFAPAGTPMPIVNRLNVEINQILLSAEMMERLAQLNLANPPVKTAEQFAETVRSDLKAWSDIVRASKLRPD